MEFGKRKIEIYFDQALCTYKVYLIENGMIVDAHFIINYTDIEKEMQCFLLPDNFK